MCNSAITTICVIVFCFFDFCDTCTGKKINFLSLSLSLSLSTGTWGEVVDSVSDGIGRTGSSCVHTYIKCLFTVKSCYGSDLYKRN